MMEDPAGSSALALRRAAYNATADVLRTEVRDIILAAIGDSDEVGHLFRSDVGRGFRIEAGQRSEMKSDAMAPGVGSGLRVIAVSFAVKRRLSGGLVF